MENKITESRDQLKKISYAVLANHGFLQLAHKTGYICPDCGNGSGDDGTGITEHIEANGVRACLQTILIRKALNENKRTQENYQLIYRNELQFSDCSSRSEKNVQSCFAIYTNFYHSPKDFSY